MQSQPKISIAVCTKNRPNSVWRLLQKLSTSTFGKNRSIIAVDQSKQALFYKRSKNIRYIHTPSTNGLSASRNRAISSATTSYIAFIDDDCIPKSTYFNELNSLSSSFWQKNSVALIFGRTDAYKPNLHAGEICPCVFQKKSSRLVDTIKDHSIHIGYGNNMVIRKDLIKNIGGFKSWLGAGSVGESAEDAEYILRCLIAGYTMGYEDSLQIYHDRWLQGDSLRTQQNRYTCGGLAAYGFYYFQGVTECKEIFYIHLTESFSRIRNDLKNCLLTPLATPRHIWLFLKEVYYLGKGVVLAFVFSKIIPIPKKEDVVRRFYNRPHTP